MDFLTNDSFLSILNACIPSTPSLKPRTETSDAESTEYLNHFLAEVDAWRSFGEDLVMTPERLNEYIALYRVTKQRCKELTETQWSLLEKAASEDDRVESHVLQRPCEDDGDAEGDTECVEDNNFAKTVLDVLGIPAPDEDSPQRVVEDFCREAAVLDALADRWHRRA